MMPPRMMPKQNPVKPAPPIAPSCVAVKPNSLPQLSKMPPRIAKPAPAARMAVNPAHRSRLAFGAIPSVFADIVLFRFGFRNGQLICETRQFYNRAAFERGLMGAQSDAGPVGGLLCVRERLAFFHERHEKFI